MLTGYSALRQELDLQTPPPHVQSRIMGSVRRTEILPDRTLETFGKKAAPRPGLRGHLLFALKHEPTDLGVLAAALRKLGPVFVRDWVLAEPTGAYSRKAWFFYEYLTGDRLDLPNAATGVYAEALDPDRHIVGARKTSSRHRIYDNLLGAPGFSPTIRRTQKLVDLIESRLQAKAENLTRDADPALLRRAVAYLYTKETKSTFEIEGETASPQREERFVAALTRAAGFRTSDKASLIELQNIIVDPRFAANDWRIIQNYVGETISGYRQRIHLICPKPEDVAQLMSSWANCADRLLADKIDPVVAAAVIAFGFVFIHPFEDGNGRVHRFLIHNVLSRTGFSPKDMIFPVSAAIVRDMAQYDAALEGFSRPLLSLIDHHLTEDDRLLVSGETADYYSYFDATHLAEYLYERVADTVQHDLAEELEFLDRFDRAYQAVRRVVDMPNNRLSLFIRLVMANGGRLSRNKRGQFAEISDDEIAAMEEAVRVSRRADP